MFRLVACVFVTFVVGTLIEAKPASGDFTYSVQPVTFQYPLPDPVPNLQYPVKSENKDVGGEFQVGPAKVNAGFGLGPDGPHANIGIGLGDRQLGFDLNPGAFIKNILGGFAQG